MPASRPVVEAEYLFEQKMIGAQDKFGSSKVRTQQQFCEYHCKTLALSFFVSTLGGNHGSRPISYWFRGSLLFVLKEEKANLLILSI